MSEAGTVSGERRIVVVVVVGFGGLVVVGATVGGRVGSGTMSSGRVGSGRAGAMATVAAAAVAAGFVLKEGSGLAARSVFGAVDDVVALEPGLPLFFVLAGACGSVAGRAVSNTISAEPVADVCPVCDVGFADAAGFDEVAPRLATPTLASPSVGVVAARAGTEAAEVVVLAGFVVFEVFEAFVEVGAMDDAAGL